MNDVIRDIDPAEAHDLLRRVPRAALGFVSADGPVCTPVRVRFEGGRYLVDFDGEVDPRPNAGDEVVLVVDEGVQFFDLRAVYVRGHLRHDDADAGFGLEPTKVVAWDYGRMRKESEGSAR